MATNHVGHFLLTLELLPLLCGRGGRVVNVSSESHRSGNLRRAPLEDLLRGRGRFSGMRAYSDSKLANVLFTFELARRHGAEGIRANAVHPGLLATRIWNQNNDVLSLLVRLFKPLMGRPRVGGRAVYRLLAEPEFQSLSGRYFKGNRETRAAAQAYDRALARDLWEMSAQITAR